MIDTRNVHIRLLEHYQQQLSDGQWQAGDRFPSMRELAERHTISQSTAGKVIARLTSEGWLEIRRGLGAFVADRPNLFAELRQMDSFTDFARANGLSPSTDVIACAVEVETPAQILSSLGLDGRSRIIYLERLRRLNGQVVIHEARWLPAKLYPGLNPDDVTGSFYALCRDRYQLNVHREDAKVRAVVAPNSCQLNCPAGLQITGLGYDSNDQPIWLQQLHYHGECFEMEHSGETTGLPRLRLRISSDFIEQLSV